MQVRNPIANVKLDDYNDCQVAVNTINKLLLDAERSIRELQQARAGIEGLMVAAQMQSGMVTTSEFLNKVCDIAMHTKPMQVGDMDYLTGLVVKTPEELEAELARSFQPQADHVQL